MFENCFNDGKCDFNGNFWVGFMYFVEKEFLVKLYKIVFNGIVMVMLDNIIILNGIVWIKDVKIMYYIDMFIVNIRVFDFDVEILIILNECLVVEVFFVLGYLDGMVIDENDNIWVGMWNGNVVVCFDFKLGKMINRIEVLVYNVISCVFGGFNFDILYVIFVIVDMIEEEKVQFLFVGFVFKVIFGVKGIFLFFFGIVEE